jgi:riboflavin biosynthesis pyrimidine reductase
MMPVRTTPPARRTEPYAELHLKIAALHTLSKSKFGFRLPLPPKLARLYGEFRLRRRTRSLVFSNFVTTLDGVVSLQVKGHDAGGDISGFSVEDRMVMGLLRSVADVVVVGSGTLDADRKHIWTGEDICPELAGDYRRLRDAMQMPRTALNVVVSASGALDLRSTVFASGKVDALIVTTPAGAKRLLKSKVPGSVQIRALRRNAATISAAAILEEISRVHSTSQVLVEGGPRLLGVFYKERLLDEQFLTLAPQIAGRESGDRRLSLVMGQSFAPRDPLWGNLIDVRQSADLLFLRYQFRDGQP